MAKVPVQKGDLKANPMTNKQMTQKERLTARKLEKDKTKDGQTTKLIPKKKKMNFS